MKIKIILFLLLFNSSISLAAWNTKQGSLNTDLQGWGLTPAITSDTSGNLYVAFVQHTNPSNWTRASIQIKKWTVTTSSWSSIGSPSTGRSSYRPALAMVGSLLYAAWYEFDYGYGGDVLVSAWDGKSWSASKTVTSGLYPDLAVIGGKLYLVCYAPTGVQVYKLDGTWSQVGNDISAGTFDLKLADVGGVPYLIASGSTIVGYKFESGSWASIGTISSGYGGMLDVAVIGSVPYVAFQDRSVSGINKIYVKHFNGSSWISDGSSLNVDNANGEAGRPALTTDGTSLWLAWSESAINNKPQLYVRKFTSGTWGAASAGLNTDSFNGSASSPSMVFANNHAQIAWSERNAGTWTRQIYVKGEDDTTVANSDVINIYGSNGSQVVVYPNEWTSLNPGGITYNSSGVGDEGYDSFRYSPQLKRAVAYGNYHTVDITSSESQNALLGYDFIRNRWDVMDLGEAGWSEHFPVNGHDTGNATVDTVHGLYITHGNLSLGIGPAYTTYQYDLLAGRGKRMADPFSGPRDMSASVYDPNTDKMLVVGASAQAGPTWIYQHNSNAWSQVNSPGEYNFPGLVYDSVNQVAILIATPDGKTSETKTYNFSTGVWTNKNPTNPIPAYGGFFSTNYYCAFDPNNVVVLCLQGSSTQVYVYCLASCLPGVTANTWTRIGDYTGPTSNGVIANQGALLHYNTDQGMFVFFPEIGFNVLNTVYAFRYVPNSTTFIPPGKWIAMDGPYKTSTPALTNSKHISLAYNPTNQKIYMTGGDHLPAGFDINAPGGESYRQETYSMSMSTRMTNRASDAGMTLEYPYCGGSNQPEGPDFVGFTYDSTRNVIWLMPGEFLGSLGWCANEPATNQCDTDYPPYYYCGGKTFKFNPNTKTFSLGPGGSNGVGNNWGAVYDSVTDRIISLRDHYVDRYNPNTGTWEQWYAPGDGWIKENQLQGVDWEARVLYFIDVQTDALYSLPLDSPGSGTTVIGHPTGIPSDRVCRFPEQDPPYPNCRWYLDDPAIVFDPVNHVVLWYRLPWGDGLFWAYHPVSYGGDKQGTWEQLEAKPVNVAGDNSNSTSAKMSAVASSMIYDPSIQAVVAFGAGNMGQADVVATLNYMFVYRYGTTTIVNLPTIIVQTPTSNPTYDTFLSTINVAGSATNVSSVTWTSDRSGGGTATGTTSWSVNNIQLQSGYNVLTFTAHDTLGNTAVDVLTVNYITTLNAGILNSGKIDLNGNARAN